MTLALLVLTAGSHGKGRMILEGVDSIGERKEEKKELVGPAGLLCPCV